MFTVVGLLEILDTTLFRSALAGSPDGYTGAKKSTEILANGRGMCIFSNTARSEPFIATGITGTLSSVLKIAKLSLKANDFSS